VPGRHLASLWRRRLNASGPDSTKPAGGDGGRFGLTRKKGALGFRMGRLLGHKTEWASDYAAKIIRNLGGLNCGLGQKQ
jgi:hypothetical protein